MILLFGICASCFHFFIVSTSSCLIHEMIVVFYLFGARSMFVFVLTDSLGVKQYAFCKRREPRKGHRKLYMECLCILSHQYLFSLFKKDKVQTWFDSLMNPFSRYHSPWFTMFSQMLDILETRRLANPASVVPFLEATLNLPFPEPGERINVRIQGLGQPSATLPSTYPLDRPDDTQLIQHHV